ncbi:hypothetical protein BC937DRAFT_95254 [Endogone sp. FLAS-F59071]|nr:hypothetical protein BC937DRAFT_95254 [Endogone sp. FLAS-F59071]|eukprot:RUS20428.1 hypothetical protein BC937DRAFT_95254 [Endogone sp. FLAS-F59071]
MMLEGARVFKALAIALADLEEFYSHLLNPQYIDSHQIGQADCKLKYDSKLSSGNYVFQARIENFGLERDVIVKFTKRYSEECHQKCHSLGIAPELLACKQIAGGWFVVVMELLSEHETLFSLSQHEPPLSNLIVDNLKKAVDSMHKAGFVHGDLRLPNIMVGPDNSIIIIDWQGWGDHLPAPPKFSN